MLLIQLLFNDISGMNSTYFNMIYTNTKSGTYNLLPYKTENRIRIQMLTKSSFRQQTFKHVRGGSRISRWGVPTLIGGGANLRHRCFLVKTNVKMKEFGPVGGGGGAPETFVCRSATACGGASSSLFINIDMEAHVFLSMKVW